MGIRSVRAMAVVAAMLLVGSMVGCSDDQASDLLDEGTEAIVRNAVAGAGEAAFEDEGIEVEGNLDCEATSTGGAERIEVSCTGMSTDGEELAIEGEAETGASEGNDDVSGSFVGTADGEEVFQEDCLGQGC
jgi:hypothetical protein